MFILHIIENGEKMNNLQKDAVYYENAVKNFRKQFKEMKK